MVQLFLYFINTTAYHISPYGTKEFLWTVLNTVSTDDGDGWGRRLCGRQLALAGRRGCGGRWRRLIVDPDHARLARFVCLVV